MNGLSRCLNDLVSYVATPEDHVLVTQLLDGLEEAYKDGSTKPVLDKMLSFVSRNMSVIFRFEGTINYLEANPEMAVDLVKKFVFQDVAN